MSFIALVPGVSVRARPVEGHPPDVDPSGSTGSPEEVRLAVGGTEFAGWVYRPVAGGGPAPCIVMAHGLGGTWELGLDLSPHRIPVFGPAGAEAAMADDGAWTFVNDHAPVGFVNEVCARVVVRMDKYHPLHMMGRIRCPVLLQVAEMDITSPARIVDRAIAALGSRGEVHPYPIDHFDIYRSDHVARAVTAQVEFFSRHLRPVADPDAAATGREAG